MPQVELTVRAVGQILVDVPEDKLKDFEAAMTLPLPMDRLPAYVEYDPESLVSDLEFSVEDLEVLDDGEDDS
jgi:hypothetical protein